MRVILLKIFFYLAAPETDVNGHTDRPNDAAKNFFTPRNPAWDTLKELPEGVLLLCHMVMRNKFEKPTVIIYAILCMYVCKPPLTRPLLSGKLKLLQYGKFIQCDRCP